MFYQHNFLLELELQLKQNEAKKESITKTSSLMLHVVLLLFFFQEYF